MEKKWRFLLILCCFLSLGMKVTGLNYKSYTSISAEKRAIEKKEKQNKLSKLVFSTSPSLKRMEKNIKRKKVELDKKSKGEYKKNEYNRRKGVILVTPDYMKGLLPTGHSSICYNKAKVIEANVDGVEFGKNNWNVSKKQSYIVTLKKTTAKQDEMLAEYCKRQINKKYNFNYFDINTRSGFYCSQLIYAAAKDLYKINLNGSAFYSILGNPIHPLELVDNSKVTLLYRK
ncbi:MAG: hypothetical protein LBD38_04715 [Streptococcaceae bacterium]|nr:hypothetical protein [Streptococcaceae bacterium]